MSNTSISCDSNYLSDIDRANFEVEHSLDGFTYYVTGIEVDWDFSIYRHATELDPTEYNDEINFDFTHLEVTIQGEHGDDVEEDSDKYIQLMSKLGDIVNTTLFQEEIIDHINER
jgi:hypothetical protein